MSTAYNIDYNNTQTKTSGMAANPYKNFWERAIILVDMNAFFASVEQMDNPELQGRPIGITNGERGSCIITCSYEARAMGIKTGMRLKDALRVCPDFIRVPAHPERYAEISSRIMSALSGVTPDMEVFSVDEAFLDITRCQKLHGSPENIAILVQRTVLEASGGILCSVGLSGDKTTAKYAAKLQKPNGLTVIPPWQSEQQLHNVPVTELCGIAKGIGQFLAARDVFCCGDMKKLPISVLANRFGNPGRRIWYMAQGLDPEPVMTDVAPPKSIGHGKVMPPETTNQGIIETFMLHMSEKVAFRLRKHHLAASHFLIALKTDNGWLGGKPRLAMASNDGNIIFKLCQQILRKNWSGQGVYQVQVTALDPHKTDLQGDFFIEQSEQRNNLLHAVDQANQRYGEFAVAPARLLKRSDMPNVIAPSWKPHGHRQTI